MSMIRESGNRFFEEIMLKQQNWIVMRLHDRNKIQSKSLKQQTGE